MILKLLLNLNIFNVFLYVFLLMTDKMVEEESCLCISFQSLETSFSEAST